MHFMVCTVALCAVVAGESKATTWDFSEGVVGKMPEGWSAAKTDKGNAWKIVEDKTASKGKVLAQTAADGPGSVFNICIAEKPKVADVDLRVKFKAVAGKKDQGGGLVWRCKDINNYYIARMNPLEDNFRLYKFVDGKRIQIASADTEAPADKWHEMRIVHKGDRIQCWLNGNQVILAKDAEFKEAGKIGLWTKADAQTYFDELVLRKAE